MELSFYMPIQSSKSHILSLMLLYKALSKQEAVTIFDSKLLKFDCRFSKPCCRGQNK